MVPTIPLSSVDGNMRNKVWSIILVLSSMFMVVESPISSGLLLVMMLVNMSILLSMKNGFMGMVLFIVYVGGIMVLFTYCLMMSPLQFFNKKKYYGTMFVLMGMLTWMSGDSSGLYEFYYLGGLVLMMGVLLFIAMMSVVEMIDMSSGALRVE
uniref:NADH dehydrogenase subunit 6 n=1 Tax=Flaccisagitta enflata TaxID=366393 RepID=D3DKP1_9BILA|nr:NADH dehydrogenase subunit 6 [Flaccisagitta enflata]BAI68190.1 NADH dehydrogenase subunit 6 [Flaccisagitta enflata]